MASSRHIKHITSTFFGILALSYGVITSLLILLWLIFAEQLFLMSMFVNLMPVALLPALILLPITAILRKWRLFMLNLLPLFIFIFFYGEIFFPKQQPSETGREITVLTHNFSYRNDNFASLDMIIQEANADIIALQEVTAETRLFLETYKLEDYPYRIYTPPVPRQQGQYILSRWPFVETHEYRPLHTLINTPYGQILVFNIHAPNLLWQANFSTDARNQIIAQAMNIAQSQEYPVLIMGDFNMTDATADYRQLRAVYQDVFRETNMGFGFTFPNPYSVNAYFRAVPSVLRLDYVFTSDDITPIESRVIRQGVSDHFPLWAKLCLP